eukprot:TRINITY_DN4375_c0_g1_i1.p1 TRINITY_DN4375_c0_g1~~TRINITY_DN4375_c0_g1_i1.p1  ORF type:complete len:1161 (+),score=613.34 TRINITY_DN4375_c0_g1_i1:148-3630(+)
MSQAQFVNEEHYIADDSVKACTNCKSSFGIFSRKHHCRLCGLIFCDKCTANKVVLPDMYGFVGPQRVCDRCATLASGRGAPAASSGSEPQVVKKGAKDTGVDDLVMLQKVNEDAIVENLKKRFNSDIIYTYIGFVLISVNPFKMIKNLYSDRTLLDYKGKYPYELSPHVFSLADQMYKTLKNDLESQCVIISGESGAGKTEASKRIMQFIAAVSGSGSDVQRVKDVILESNPLLEAFGNAKTLRNNNSSRFGKYMEIQFTRVGDPEGGRISNYLLEKSRVVYQTRDERGFHIFYQILCGLPADILNEFGLGGGLHPSQFGYLAGSGCYEVDGIDDFEEFKEVMKAMSTMQITKPQQIEVFRLILAVLYLGNIDFAEGSSEQSNVANRDGLEAFAYMFRVNASQVEKALTSRTMATGTEGRSARVSVYSVPQNRESALYARDALSKALYSRLFDWIVAKINESMYINDPQACVIGVLDIYGFEIFENNGFEQLCINYVNEKLQQIFIQLTLKAEQEEYHAEGIKWEDIKFFNNKICCDLIESKNPMGLLTILDDTCNFPKGTDEKFIQKMNESFASHAHYAPSGPTHFTIKHYAGDVLYNADGFCDKNKDLLINDLIEICQMCGSQFINSLFPESAGKDDKKRPTTAGFKIKDSIGRLVQALSQCTPHYIRCIKPNNKKAANNFDTPMVHHQVCYLGLLENVRVRRAGYAFRAPFERFFYRYRVCSSRTWPQWEGDVPSGCKAILDSINLDNKEHQFGKTKMFIRAPETIFALEELRERRVWNYSIAISEFFRSLTGKSAQFALQSAAAQKLRGQKERRRLSFERKYKSDYLSLRENIPLKAIVERYGEDKVFFADNCNTFDHKCKSFRRCLLLTDKAVYIIGLAALPPAGTDPKKAPKVLEQTNDYNPFKYVMNRRIELGQISSISLSTLADNFMVIHVQNQHDLLIDCRRKTELLETITRQSSAIRFEIKQPIMLQVKASKKLVNKTLLFEKNESASTATFKDYKVSVATGLPSSSVPNFPEPAKMKTVSGVTRPDSAYSAPSGGGASSGRGAPKATPKAAPRGGPVAASSEYEDTSSPGLARQSSKGAPARNSSRGQLPTVPTRGPAPTAPTRGPSPGVPTRGPSATSTNPPATPAGRALPTRPPGAKLPVPQMRGRG